MSKVLILCGLISLLPISIFGADSKTLSEQQSEITNFINELPMSFTENKGQWDETVIYRADANGAVMWFTKTGVYYQFMRRVDEGIAKINPSIDKINNEQANYESIMIKASFVDANRDPQMFGEMKLEHNNNYFKGNEPDKWHTDVPNYAAVVYEDIYPGIDLKYYGNGKQMEYDFIVSPGADPSQVKVQYDGAKSLTVDSDGRLVVQTEWGTVTEEKPVIFQNIDGKRELVSGEYELKDDNTFGFNITQNYNKDIPIVIDPVLSYSTYLGGNADETCFDIDIDDNGNSYIVGYTSSSDFPTQSPYQVTYGEDIDVFVTKFNPAGNALVFSTFLGGLLADHGYCIDVDANDNIYISGKTASTDFPTQNAYQATNGGGTNDVFISKLGSAGNTLEYSTYLGGTLDEDASGIIVDNNGDAYIAGRTKSTDYPTQNAYQSVYGGGTYDGFVTKIDSAGNTLVYSTYIGGTDYDLLRDIAVDNSGNAIVSGGTASSSDYPLKNAYQAVFGGGFFDNFVTKLGADGDTLVFSTFFGGNDYDLCYAIDLDASGNIYIIGNTSSTDFPTQNPYQASFRGGTYDVFVSKFNSSGTVLEYSTYLGGSGGGSYDVGYGISVNNNKASVVGYTTSTTFPTANPYQSVKKSGSDIFITTFNEAGNILEFSTYFGGNANDMTNAVAVSNSGDIYLSGYTNSTNFPTLNAYQDTIHDTLPAPPAAYDAFVVKFNANPLSVEEIELDLLPDDFSLSQNYPNPFNPSTTIKFQLKTRSHVEIEIFNILGRKVNTLVNDSYGAGNYQVNWDGTDENGSKVSSGMYLYRFSVDGYVQTKKMLLLK